MTTYTNGKGTGTRKGRTCFVAAAVVCGLCLAWLPGPAHAGRGEVVELVVKGARWVGKRLGREAGEEAAERLVAREVAEIAARFGDDAVRLVSEAGEAGLRVARRAEFGTKVLPLARRFGSEVVELEARSPGLGVAVFRAFGESAARFAPKLSEGALVRAVRLARKGGAETAEKLGRVLETFGEKGLNTVERIFRILHESWKGATVVMAAAVVLTHPELVEKGVRDITDIPAEVVEALGHTLTESARTAPGLVWGLLTAGVVVLLGRVFLREWFRARARTVARVARG